MHVSSFLMEQYLEAADKVLDAAIVNGPKPRMIKKRFNIKDEKSVKATGSVYRHLEDAVAIFSSWVSANIQVTLWNFFSHFRGNYRFRISAYAFQTEKPVTFHMTAGTMTAVTEERIVGYYDVPPGKPTVIEFVEKLEPRNTVRFVVDGLGVIPTVVEKVGADKYKGPGLAVQWVEIEGPLHETLAAAKPSPHLRRPCTRRRRRPRRQAARRSGLEEPLADAERILRDFARRAFRRAVTDGRDQAVPRPREGQAGREVLVRAGDARRPQGRAGVAALPVPAKRSPASSTTSPWPAGCRTSSGVRCPTRNCSPSPSRGN